MSGGEIVPRPKRYGLLKGKIEIPEDFDAPMELGEIGMSETDFAESDGQSAVPESEVLAAIKAALGGGSDVEK